MPITGIGRYTPGSGRRTVDLHGGGRVTRTTAENMFAQKHGFANDRALRRAQQSEGYKRYKSSKNYKNTVNRAKARGTNQTDLNAAAANYYSDPANRNDNSPDGPKARMLEAMGRRNPQDDWNVGESPTVT
jgi:hypothetical protein